MNRFYELVNNLYVAHKEFTKAWNEHLNCRKQDKEKKISQVNALRDKFWKALHELFDNLGEYIKPFLAGEPFAIDAVIEFAEVDIPAFRCGYSKQWYFRKLKSLPLSDTQQERLRLLAVSMCESRNYGREFADITRLMIKLADANFIEKLRKLQTSPDNLVQQKANRMLKVISNHRKDLEII